MAYTTPVQIAEPYQMLGVLSPHIGPFVWGNSIAVAGIVYANNAPGGTGETASATGNYIKIMYSTDAGATWADAVHIDIYGFIAPSSDPPDSGTFVSWLYWDSVQSGSNVFIAYNHQFIIDPPALYVATFDLITGTITADIDVGVGPTGPIYHSIFSTTTYTADILGYGGVPYITCRSGVPMVGYSGYNLSYPDLAGIGPAEDVRFARYKIVGGTGGDTAPTVLSAGGIGEWIWGFTDYTNQTTGYLVCHEDNTGLSPPPETTFLISQSDPTTRIAMPEFLRLTNGEDAPSPIISPFGPTIACLKRTFTGELLLLISSDGGATWTDVSVSPPFGYLPFYESCAPDTRGCIHIVYICRNENLGQTLTEEIRYTCYSLSKSQITIHNQLIFNIDDVEANVEFVGVACRCLNNGTLAIQYCDFSEIDNRYTRRWFTTIPISCSSTGNYIDSAAATNFTM